MISYSANLEDVILNRVFADVDSGFYVDIGSYKPIECSNTMALYSRGWRGVACDPIYHFEQLWAKEWRDIRPRDIVIRDMVSDSLGEADYFMCNYRGLSTGAKHVLDRQTGFGANIMNGGSKVGTTTLTRILDHCLNNDVLHLVCIDVEGMEEQVLKGLDFTRYKPWVFVIEAMFSFDASSSYESWEPLLLDHNYKPVYDDRVNRFYLHPDHMDLSPRFGYPPNVLDGYKTYREWVLEGRLAEFESTRPWFGHS